MKLHINNLEEAGRYLAHAKQILKERAGKEDGHYADKKYARMAGNTAYNGILEALDIIVPPSTEKARKSADYYKEQLSKKDKKLLRMYIDAYNILHLYMGYDGDTNANIVKEGIRVTEELIERVATISR